MVLIYSYCAKIKEHSNGVFLRSSLQIQELVRKKVESCRTVKVLFGVVYIFFVGTKNQEGAGWEEIPFL